jgi:hypothetical protein
MARDENMIAALKRERASYVAQGKIDRVDQVDEQLRHHGYEPDSEPEKEPKGRTSTPQQTADAGKPPAKKTAAKKTAAAPPAG